MLRRFFRSRYSRNPSTPFFSAHSFNIVRSFSTRITGTPNPHDVCTRVTSTTTICRTPGNASNRPTNSPHAASPSRTTCPLPYNRKIRGFPSNAQNITVTRPFSRTCAAVSFPLPVKSRYITRVGDNTRNVSIPFGDTFTCPSPDSGALPTKNTTCPRMNAANSGVIPSCVAPTAYLLLKTPSTSPPDTPKTPSPTPAPSCKQT
jgi:hypothetical protein